jgi:hypothetical protein
MAKPSRYFFAVVTAREPGLYVINESESQTRRRRKMASRSEPRRGGYDLLKYTFRFVAASEKGPLRQSTLFLSASARALLSVRGRFGAVSESGLSRDVTGRLPKALSEGAGPEPLGEGKVRSTTAGAVVDAGTGFGVGSTAGGASVDVGTGLGVGFGAGTALLAGYFARKVWTTRERQSASEMKAKAVSMSERVRAAFATRFLAAVMVQVLTKPEGRKLKTKARSASDGPPPELGSEEAMMKRESNDRRDQDETETNPKGKEQFRSGIWVNKGRKGQRLTMGGESSLYRPPHP